MHLCERSQCGAGRGGGGSDYYELRAASTRAAEDLYGKGESNTGTCFFLMRSTPASSAAACAVLQVKRLQPLTAPFRTLFQTKPTGSPEAKAVAAAWDVVGAPTGAYPEVAAPACDATFATKPKLCGAKSG